MCRSMILLVFVFSSNAQEYFNVTRQPSTQSDDFSDVFQIPPSLCGKGKGATECYQMGGRKIGDCQCTCDMKAPNEGNNKSNVIYKSTFLFNDGEWQCVNNSLLRKQAGCLRLTQELYDPISTLSRTSSNSTEKLVSLYVPSNSPCVLERLLADNTSYLDCEGRWKSIKGSRFNHTQYGVELIPKSFRRLEPRLDGLIIRLGVKCINRSSVSCLLLKLDGHQICSKPTIAKPTLITVFTSNLSSCGNKCKTLPTPPSKLHIAIIMVLLGVVILVLIVIASVLINKARLNTRRKRSMRQLFVTNMTYLAENNEHGQSYDEDGYLCPIDNNAPRDKRYEPKELYIKENNEHGQNRDDVMEVDQSCHEDGYLCPIDNNAPREKRYEPKELYIKEMDGNAERVYIEQPGSSMAEPYEITNLYRLHDSLSEIKPSAVKLTCALQSPLSGGPSECNRHKPNIIKPDQNNAEHFNLRNNHRSKVESIYRVLEDPRAFGISDEVGQLIIENVPQDQSYQELTFDGQRFNVYQSLCIANQKGHRL